MDEHYLENSEQGAGRMRVWLTMDKGYKINIKRVRQLYTKVMGLRSTLPSPNTSKPSKKKDKQVFPYLLRDLKVTRPNQVWATDITYIPIQGRCIDKVFIERLWWSVKYEDAYIREYKDGKELHVGMQQYFQKYNFERRYAGIEHDLPCNRYFIDKTA